MNMAAATGFPVSPIRSLSSPGLEGPDDFKELTLTEHKLFVLTLPLLVRSGNCMNIFPCQKIGCAKTFTFPCFMESSGCVADRNPTRNL
jgi:hypothetical protein